MAGKSPRGADEKTRINPEKLANTNHTNTSPAETWRAAFREEWYESHRNCTED